MNARANDAAPLAPVPRLALPVDEAAEALGMKETFFRSHVLPELRVIRRGSLRFIAVAELARWAENEGTLAGVTDRRSVSG